MTPEQLKHKFDLLAETTRRFSLARDISQHYKSVFEALVKRYGQSQKRDRVKMQPEMAMAWLITRAAFRCQGVFHAEMSKAREDLEHSLLEFGQRLGERLPHQYQSDESNSAL